MNRNVPQRKLMDTERYHERALAILNAMYEHSRQNLIKRYGNDVNASVNRKIWRAAMCEQFGIYNDLANDIEKNLEAEGKVELLATFAKPIVAPEPKPQELDMHQKFFCTACKKYKGIPYNYRKYYEGDKVNYTQKGIAGGIATNQVGSIQHINGRTLEIATGTRYVKLHQDSVTPEWAPPPLLYSTMGQCWCDIDPAYLPGAHSE